MSKGKFVAVMSALSLVAALSALDQTVVATALPHIIASLNGASALGWVLTGYFLGATATVAVTGKICDLFGRRRVFIAAIMLFGLASLLAGLANSMLMLVVFRGLQGIGAGSIQTCSLIVMGDMFSPRERGKWQAINSIGFATASAIGPAVGGLLSDNLSWRWIFLINVPICLATIAAILYGLRDVVQTEAKPRIDWAGGMWSILSVTTLLLALTWGGREYAWTSPEIFSLLGATLMAALLLLRAEKRASEPVIPGELLRGRVAPFACLAALGNSAVWFGMILLVPLRLQLVLGATATEAGATLTPGIVLGPICSFIAGRTLSRSGRYRRITITAGAFQMAGVGMMLFSPAWINGRLWVAFSYCVVATGCGLGGPCFVIAFSNGIPFKKLGAGMGLVSLFRQLGASLSTAVCGTIVGAGVVAAGVAAAQSALHEAFLFELLASALVLVISWMMADLPLRTTVMEVESESSRVLSAALDL